MKSTMLSAMVAVMFLTACTDDSNPAPPTEDLLAPPAAGEGVQYSMVTTIEPGTEVEHCKFFEGPPEGMHVQNNEVRFTEGSHHVLFYVTGYTEIPTEKDDGTPIDTSGVFDCSDGARNGWTIIDGLGGSQNPSQEKLAGFPPGVAKSVAPGQVLMMNAHYLNTTSEVLEPEVRVNLYTIPESEVETAGDSLFWYNVFIKVAAQSEGRARMRCEIHEDITLLNLSSHMHKRGVDFSITTDSGEVLYENTKWEDVPTREFEGGLEIPAGTTFDYHCDYDNSEMRDVYQGPRTTDEMCMLLGAYYPADELTSTCGIDSPFGVIPIGGDWIGNGTATCTGALGCVAAGAGAGLEGITPCILDADPAVAPELSDAERCFLLQSFIGGDPEAECAAEIDACLAL